jgi:TRAP-type mannitol/chloroaromatic compound transport system permease small subunit
MAIMLINIGFIMLAVSGVLFAIGCLVAFEGERVESEKEWQETLKRTGGLSGRLSSAQLELPA